MRLLPIVIALLILVAPAMSRADALPSCPPGQHMQANPIPPGAMHHAGATCVADEPGPATDTPPPEQPSVEPAPPAQTEAPASSGGCSASPRSSGGAPLACLGLLALALRRRR